MLRGSDTGELVHEPSHVLSLVHPADAASETAVGEIVAEYKNRFEQEAVLRVRSPAFTWSCFFATFSERVKPGASEFTVMPSAPSSRARPRVMAITAPLLEM